MVCVPVPTLVEVYVIEQSDVFATPWSTSVHLFGIVNTLPAAALNAPDPELVKVNCPVGEGFPPPAPLPTTVAIQTVATPKPTGSGVQVTVIVYDAASVKSAVATP